MKLQTVVASIALLAFVAAAVFGADKIATQPPKLRLAITTKNNVVSNAKPLEIEAHITNLGDKPVTLVQPGDGSNCGWRTPLIGWSVRPAGDMRHPDKPRMTSQARCGNINTLGPDEVFTIESGATAKFSSWVMRPNIPGRGKHTVVFYYENRPDLQWKGIPLGRHDPAAMRKVKSSTPCKLVSNELIVERIEE